MVIGNLTCMTVGATMVYSSEGFSPAAALEAATEHGCTAIYGVPTMFIAYIEEFTKNPKKYNLKLRTGFVAGSNCPEALMEKIHSELGVKGLASGYGMTELSP